MSVQALGWTLLHFTWQGTVVAAALAVALRLLRGRAPQLRYLAASGALFAMLALPVATFELLRTPRPEALEPTVAAEPQAAVQAGPTHAVESRTAGLRTGTGRGMAPYLPLVVGLWLTGVLVLSLRSLGGWLLVQRIRRGGLRPPRPDLEAMLGRLVHRLGVRSLVGLYESSLVHVPTAIGCLKPVVLMPAAALTSLSPDQIELILAHELAHVRRADYLVNLLQTAAETLLFYHPAVWWVSHRMRVERELVCDDLAVSACGDAVSYARALAELAALRPEEPLLAVAATGGGLADRVARLVGAEAGAVRGRLPMLTGTGLALALCAGVVVLAMAPRSTAQASTPRFRNQGPSAFQAPLWARAVPAGTSYAGSGTRAVLAAAVASPAPAPPAKAPAQPAAAARPAPQPSPSPKPRAFPLDRILELANAGVTPEYIDAMAGLGYPSLTVDELLELRSQGVGPDYVRALAQAGYRSLSADDLVRLRSHGVSPEDAEAFRREGLADVSLEELVALRDHGVGPEYLGALKQAGYGDLSVSRLIALRDQGVSADYVARMKALGYTNLSTTRLIALRSMGVTPEYVEGLAKLGYKGLDVTMLLGLRSMGVSPEYVRDLQSLGYSELPAGVLVELRSHGVTPDYVRELKAAGFDNLTPAELVRLRDRGVGGELLKRLRRRH